jgi:endonuclease/exonuclease/phosphatase family metal-dependent hydrolase
VRIRCATWNIHRCVGRDGRWDPARTVKVLRALDADIVALQEVEIGTDNAILDELSSGTGMRGYAGPTMPGERGHYGNAILTRFRARDLDRIDLSVPPHEPRGALTLNVAISPDHLLEVVATHLGLSPGERRQQVRLLLAHLPPIEREGPGVLMGDFNEWFLWGRPLRWLRARYAQTRALATYPTRWPLVSLDRIWIRPGSGLIELDTLHDDLARIASDHLPLRAVIEL